MDVVCRTGCSMRASDGTLLVADIWLPAGQGPWPALLVRTPYGRELASAVTAPHPSVLARAGYLVVTQDVRGRGDSAGMFVPFAHEASDGAEAVAWVAALPECNGRVGMYGFSYQGLCQLLTAALRPPALAAIAPAMTSADPAAGFLFEGGILRLDFAVSWGSQLGDVDGFAGPAAAQLLAPRLAVERVDAWPYWDDWAAGRCGPAADVSQVDVPSLFTVGTHDQFAIAGMRDAATLQRAGTRTHLLVAPWSHLPWSPDAHVATATHLAFFDRYLRGAEVSLASVRTLETGIDCQAADRSWVELDSWDGGVQWEQWGLFSEGQAASRWGDGALVLGSSTGVPDIAVFQPAVPVPSIGDACGSAVGLVGRHDQSPAQDRTDVLCYTGPALEHAVVLRGSPRASISLQSNAPSLDACLTLSVVDAEGRAFNVSSGAKRAFTAEETGPIEVELGPVHLRVPAGARLRLAVAPSAYPRLSVNRSSGMYAVTRALAKPSWLHLPVVTGAGQGGG